MLKYLNFAVSFDDPNTRIWFFVLLGILIVAIILIAVIPLIIKKKKKKAAQVVEKENDEKLNTFLGFIGGKENLKEFELVGSRLTLVLENNKLVDKENIKKLGIDRILEMSNKIILVGKFTKDLFLLLEKM